MTALLCLLVGVAALVFAVVLPEQRLNLGLVAVVAGAAAAALAPAARRRTAPPHSALSDASSHHEDPADRPGAVPPVVGGRE